MLRGTDIVYDEEYTPNLSEYHLETDFSNIINPWDIKELSSEAKDKLVQNLFVACESTYERSFFGIYENNSSASVKIPSFITTDSLFHTFHLYYETIQKITEKEYLIDRIAKMSNNLLINSKEQLAQLKGSSFESAAQRNVDFFSVAVALFGGTDYVKKRHG